MDKYEYKLKLEQLKNLVQEKDYVTAAEIADTINWRKVKSAATLCMVGEIYDRNKRYEDSREILLMAYDRATVGRNIIYRLTLVALKMGNLEEAKEYYEEFLEVAPYDNLKYILRYEIAKVGGAPTEELIEILEEFKEREYIEEWAFELAYLYHRSGNSERCVEICDELILWFGDGRYVEKALELKMLYQPLNRNQEDKYRQFKLRKEGIVEVKPTDMLESGEIVRETVQIPNIETGPGRFNTMNLQEELAKSMQQILDANTQETVSDTMDNIKRMVEEIPFLQTPAEEQELEMLEEIYGHIETDEEIDDSLKTDFRELLGVDHDGQFRLVVPGGKYWEPQVNGQMSMEEVLAEWEKTKRAAEVAMAAAQQRKLESAKAKALQEAGDIMNRLTDAMPRLDAGVSPQELLAERYLQNTEGETLLDENGFPLMEGEIPLDENGYPLTEEVLLDENGFPLTEGAALDENGFPLMEGEIPLDENGFPLMEGEIPLDENGYPLTEGAALDENGFPLMEGEIPLDENGYPLTEGAALDENGYPIARGETALDGNGYPLTEGAALDENGYPLTEEVLLDENGYPIARGETALDGNGYPLTEGAALDENGYPLTEGAALDETVSQTMDAGASLEEAAIEENLLNELSEKAEEKPQMETQQDEVPLPKIDIEDIQAEDKARSDFEALIEQQAAREPLAQGPTEEQMEAMLKAAIESELEGAKETIPEIKVEDEPITRLSDEQKEIFSYFVPVTGMEQQLCQVLEGALHRKGDEKSSATGNILIVGGRGSGKTVLATDLIKAIQKSGRHPAGKVGKITGASLNQKDLSQLLKKVAGGYLIIEKAGELSQETVTRLAILLEQDTDGLLVILEDTRAGIEKVMGRDANFSKKFTERIKIPVFTSDELVEFAKAYAMEQECEIDDMGILALYNCISNIQKLDEATTLAEVKEIVDEAISSAERGGLKKLFGGRRYSPEGYLYLREKDFDN